MDSGDSAFERSTHPVGIEEKLIHVDFRIEMLWLYYEAKKSKWK